MEKADIITAVFIIVIIIGLGLLFTTQSKSNIKNIFRNAEGKKAPELQGITGYINSNENIRVSNFIGKKVVLVDFWTYTCINCIRTLPYIKQWDQKYRDMGLQIIGVHTPEFEFEKDYNNVKKAVEDQGIKYPVVLDSNYATWNAYDNHYWPAKYLIDKNGNIVYTHFGEGNYQETEAKIQELLTDLKNTTVKVQIKNPGNVEAVEGEIGTPEIYFGYNFRRTLLGNQPTYLQDGQIYNFEAPENILPNSPYLVGTWKNNADNFELISGTGKILLYYKAKSVNIVAGSEQGSSIISSANGTSTKETSINNFNMYRVLEGISYEPRILELNITGKGFKIYTFTFG